MQDSTRAGGPVESTVVNLLVNYEYPVPVKTQRNGAAVVHLGFWNEAMFFASFAFFASFPLSSADITNHL
jgi:hypothetical protein